MKTHRTSHVLASLGVSFFLSMASLPAASMLGYYAFEDNFDDSSGSGNNAAASQNPTEVTFALGFRGQGIEINDPDTAAGNTSGSVDIPIDVDPALLPEVTFGGWVNTDANQFYGFMSTDNGGWDRGLTVNAQESNSFGAASGAAPVNLGMIVPDSWQYVVASFSRAAGTTTLYVGDATEATQTTESGTTVDSAVAPGEPVIEIGRYNNQDLDGLVDDVFVVDDALDAHQINAIRNMRLNMTLDYTPLQALEVFTLFEDSQIGVVDGSSWAPTSGLDAANPGAVFDLGKQGIAVVLDDAGNGMLGDIEGFVPMDTDKDGMEDFWETTFFGDLTRDGTGDFDMDNLTDFEEFNEGTNPAREDSDSDGLLDGDEVNGSNEDKAVTNPLDPDTDDDGLSDGDEVLGDNPNDFTSNPTLADTDGDGFSDPDEIAAGTDPRDAGDFPRPPPAGLLAFYEFEDDFLDSSGNGNTAVPTQNPDEVSFTAGFRGQGADINDPAADGGGNTGGTINIPINANPTETPEVTFGGWVNLETNNGFPGFMAIDNGGWDRGMHLNTNTWGIASGGNTPGVAPATVGEWQYVVGTFSKPDNEAVLYVGDDDPLNQITITGAREDGGNNPGETMIEIGRYDNQDLDAVVDDMFVFEGALSAHQVNAVRNLRLSSLDYSPLDAAELFGLFTDDASGNINGISWSPTSGLATDNPGEVVELGRSFSVLLDDVGNGMQSGPAILFAITRIALNEDSVEFDFNSRTGRSYAVDFSIDLNLWLEADDGVQATGALTTFVDPSHLAQPTIYYRVRRLD